LWCADLGEFEESLIIKFNNGQVRRIDSYCASKRFDTVVKHLRDINDSIEIKNRENVKKVDTEEVKEKNRFEWGGLINSINEEKMISFKQYVEKMKENQEFIYYASAKNKDQVNAMPQMDLVKKQGYDVLILNDDVDEFLMKLLKITNFMCYNINRNVRW
jgi:HSP90 family molecular chaperone